MRARDRAGSRQGGANASRRGSSVAMRLPAHDFGAYSKKLPNQHPAGPIQKFFLRAYSANELKKTFYPGLRLRRSSTVSC